MHTHEKCNQVPANVHAHQFRHAKASHSLKDGINVIYDATNITRKSRLSILNQLPAYVEKKCIITWAPIDECIGRDACRERTVGVEVINKMLQRFEAPFYDEGFDDIEIYFVLF